MTFLCRYGWKNFLLWTTIGTLDFVGGYFNDFVWDRPFYWNEEMPFASSWFIWFLLTPPVARLSERQRRIRNSTVKTVSIHAVAFFIVNAMAILLTTTHIFLVSRILNQMHAFEHIFSKISITGLFYNSVVYGGIVLLTNAMLAQRELAAERTRTAELERSRAEQRLLFLNQQLQPHFLFNTHHSIITLMKMHQWDNATRMMETLSELMRVNLREQDKQLRPLHTEMQTLQLYMDIQQVRFGDRLHITAQIHPTAEAALVPSMLLQPLVENSIKHTVENSASAGHIEILVDGHKERLHLTVRDNGTKGGTNSGFGIGLNNTRERLQTLYNEEYLMDIRFLDCGTEVNIEIPLMYDKL